MTRIADDQKKTAVREWAWLAITKEFAQNLIKNISYLVRFTNQSANLRRFACELSRPRGVWCRHILEFRKSPWLRLEIIEPLKSDEAKYGQLSVGNWLNDASKTQSDWVKNCVLNGITNHTYTICKRGLRTIHKKKNFLGNKNDPAKFLVFRHFKKYNFYHLIYLSKFPKIFGSIFNLMAKMPN